MLRANNSRLSVTPGRLRSGVASIAGAGLMVAVGNQYLPGASRSRFGSKALTAPFGSAPEGYVHPQAWILPQKPGSLKVYPAAEVSFTPSANLHIGRPLAGDINVDFTTSGNLDMVVAFSGSATFDFTVDASLDGIVNVSGATSIDVTTSGDLDMLVALTGASSFSFTPSANQTGITSLSGEVSPFTELSPQNLAAAVWDATASEYNTANTMGNKLNSAGAAADPWTVALEGTYTAADLMKIMSSVLAGKVTKIGDSYFFRDVNDTTDRVAAETDSDAQRLNVTIDVS